MAEPSRTAGILRVLWITLALNWLVAAGKIAVGVAAGSLTVMADGFHSLLDGANNVVAIVAMRLAAMPPDADHPYGHNKYEHVAAMIIGGLVMLMCWETVEGVIDRVRGGHAGGAEPTGLGIAVVLATLCINLGVAWYERREGERLGSGLLKADATHTLSDSAVSAMSLVSLLASARFWWIDPALALVVAGFLGAAAWAILNDNIATMTDRSRLDPEAVRQVAESVGGVRQAHAIRSHGMEHDIHLDLHFVVAADLSAREAAEIEERLRAELKRAFAGVTLITLQHEVEEPDAGEPIWKQQ